MSYKCELSGTKVLHGHMVSHSNRKTKRKFKPNLRNITFFSDYTKQKYKFLISTRCIRSIEKIGSFDSYILKTSNTVLSNRAQIIKKKIKAKQ